jgi:hypothetical protein
LTVHVQGRELSSGNSLRGCIHLVDLAGSERVDKSEVTGDRLKEAQHKLVLINKYYGKHTRSTRDESIS